MALDLLIRGGSIVDGSGAARYRGDVGIKDGRIVEIGRSRSAAERTIDADGLIVAPGFIDGHTHMDAQVAWDRMGSCSCWHGVTTVIMGNCGFALAPCPPAEREWFARCLTAVEDIPTEAMMAGIDWTWETFPEYLATVDRLPKAINYGAYIGHSALRMYVMGKRALSEPAAEDDLARMVAAVQEAIRVGAMGFSSSRATTHVTPDDTPVASRIAVWSELDRLVGAMAELNAGVFQIGPDTSGDAAPAGRRRGGHEDARRRLPGRRRGHHRSAQARLRQPLRHEGRGLERPDGRPALGRAAPPSGRGDDRSGARERRSGVRAAAGQRGPRARARHAAAPAHARDLLRFGGSRLPGDGLVAPDAPAELLGASAPGVHARGSSTQAHLRQRLGVGAPRPRARAHGLPGRRRDLRRGTRAAGDADRANRPTRRGSPSRSEGRRDRRHRRQRAGDPGERRDHRPHAGRLAARARRAAGLTRVCGIARGGLAARRVAV